MGGDSTAGGSPFSEWIVLYSEPWDPHVDVEALSIELKGGTSQHDPAPGRVVWDNFAVAASAERQP